MRTAARPTTASRLNLANVLWLLAPAVLSPLSFAHAYLDPGTGSYAIQIAIGVIFGAAYSLRSFGSRILGKFRSRQDGKNKPDA
jgi:hypothetical protein